MHKSFFLLLTAVLLLICVSASAEEYPLTPCGAVVTIGDNYTVTTLETLSQHPGLLSSLNKTAEEAEADWKERGVLLQAWTVKRDACLEITAVQDEAAKTWYDLEQQTRSARSQYEKDQRAAYKAAGYTLQSVAWKNHAKGGNFLVIKYKYDEAGVTHRGVMQKTVRNGYTLTLNYEVFNRTVREASDPVYLNRIVNSIVFGEAASLSDNASGEAPGLLQFSSKPPVETSTETFTVEGHCLPGAHLIGVLMRLSSTEPVRFEADANKAGNFKIKVTLPEEGVWLMTVTADADGKTIAYEAFQPTTYSKTLIPVTFSAPIPEVLVADETVISGVTSKGVDVQCIASDGQDTFTKQIRTNGTGKFNFKIPTEREATYSITLVFSKKGYNTVRNTYTAARELTEADKKARIRKEAISPSWSVLNNKISGYIGKTMGYQLYIVSVEQIGEEWIITAAQTQNKNGYRNVMIFVSSQDPALETGSRVRLYGRCTGVYQVQAEDENTHYPSFDLYFAE